MNTSNRSPWGYQNSIATSGAIFYFPDSNDTTASLISYNPTVTISSSRTRHTRLCGPDLRICKRCGVPSLIPIDWKKAKCASCRDFGQGPKRSAFKEVASVKPPPSPSRDVRFLVAKERAALRSVKLRSRRDFKQKGGARTCAKP